LTAEYYFKNNPVKGHGMEKKYNHKVTSLQAKTSTIKRASSPTKRRPLKKNSVKLKEAVTVIAETLKDEIVSRVGVAKKALTTTYQAAKDIFKDDDVPTGKKRKKAGNPVHLQEISPHSSTPPSTHSPSSSVTALKKEKQQEKR
jgi:hypothetical protein